MRRPMPALRSAVSSPPTRSVTLTLLGVPFPLLWALWVALVDFLPMVGGALAGIPTVLFARSHSLTAGIVTAVAFIAYQQVENHVLNPVIMSRTVNVNPLLVLLSILVGTSIGGWLGGFFGSFRGRIAFHPGLRVPCMSSRGNCGWLPSGSHRPTARGQPAPNLRSATSKHPRRTASLMTKSRIQARGELKAPACSAARSGRA